MRRALLSVSDKRGLDAFARGLVARGFALVSTGGTAAALSGAGLPVTAVSDVTGFPEMMDGRVKTLHPKVHGGILARRHEPADLAAAAREGIGLIDVVAVNLYPFARTAADPAASFADLVEQIDIGGPSLVRAAAKNFRDVFVVVDPADYDAVLAAIDDGGGAEALRFALARRAFAHTAAYDTTIAQVLETVSYAGAASTRTAPPLAPGRLVLDAAKVRDLRYGENPHQPAAWYAIGDGPGLGAASVLQGKELSYTNLLDLDAAARLVLEFEEPAAAVIKHTNPCGVATGASAAAAYVAARDADALSAFGGIVGLNRPVDAATAQALTATFIEAVVAPAVTGDARSLLAAKPSLRVVVMETAAFRAPDGPRAREVRSVLGGLLLQARDVVGEAAGRWPHDGVRVMTARAPTPDEWTALRFAWRVCAHVKSNTVLFADTQRTRAIGAGQMSRVDAVQVAVMKAAGWRAEAAAARPLAGTVAASDAFCPVRDGVDAVASAGATAVVHPGGSVRDAEVIAAADEHGLAMVFTGRRHFRH
jgi:phosphoribosylaminoimidazolecarboxamide formyltransferase/IMP cyclohydrolase